jgi:hypothetical protein
MVCEGKKTEPNYFEEIRQKARLSNAHIHVLGSNFGTDPISVVRYAEEVFVEKGGAFERVYAIFDRDDHQNYEAAISMATAKSGALINDEKEPVIFQAIVSVPCFELWLLLHYVSVTAFVPRDRVLRQLREHISGYEKGMTGVFTLLESVLRDALTRAKRLQSRNSKIPGDELYTDVHELVELLTSIKSVRSR